VAGGRRARARRRRRAGLGRAFGWFGRLPGDVRHEGERARVFVPVTSMIVVSVVLTVVINLVGRWLR
jgi:hypothetical protein